MQFFDENDAAWNEIVDTRLVELRRARQAGDAPVLAAGQA